MVLGQDLLQRLGAEAGFQSLPPTPIGGVLDSRQASTYRLCLSITATRYTLPPPLTMPA